MKKLFKSVSLFVLTFILIPFVKAQTVEEVLETKVAKLNSIPLTTEALRGEMGNHLYLTGQYEGYSISVDPSDAYKGTITKSGPDAGEPVEISIEYNFDESVKKVVDKLIEKLGTEEMSFYMTDIEYFNYNVQLSKYYRINENDPLVVEKAPSPGNFSSELRKTLEYSNFDLKVGLGGYAFGLYEYSGGGLVFYYNDTIYGVAPVTVVYRRPVIYIPEDTTDVVKAIKDRLGKYFTVDSVEVAQYMGDDFTITKAKEKIIAEIEEEWTNSHEQTWSTAYGKTKEEYKNEELAKFTGEGKFGSYINSDKIVDVLYDIEIEGGVPFTVAVLKDDELSSVENKIITNDINSGVELSTDSAIPLDVLIQVAKVTSGDEYDKIVKLLNRTNLEMFDLKLYSGSTGYITKLEDGKFKIKLPIKKELQGKTLKVFYVDENDKIVEYPVTISEDGEYAIFETDHFSIYTLAEATKNPKTGDNIIIYVATLMLSSSYLLTRKLRKN